MNYFLKVVVVAAIAVAVMFASPFFEPLFGYFGIGMSDVDEIGYFFYMYYLGIVLGWVVLGIVFHQREYFLWGTLGTLAGFIFSQIAGFLASQFHFPDRSWVAVVVVFFELFLLPLFISAWIVGLKTGVFKKKSL